MGKCPDCNVKTSKVTITVECPNCSGVRKVEIDATKLKDVKKSNC